MSYLCGSYLSGDAPLTDEQAFDAAMSNAASDKQLNNYKFYYAKVAALSPAARQNLLAQLNNILSRMPAKNREVILSAAMRTASYADPRSVVGLGDPVTGAASTVATVAAITGIVATLGTIGLQVATTLDQRKQQQAVANQAKETQDIQQNILRAQLQEQELRIADLKTQQAAKASTAQPAIGPNGELIVPSTKPSAAAVGTGVALTAAAAYLLTK